MKLLRLTLDGEYKGLTSQTFDFSHSQDNIIAFIGLNGSGKSQLLELIAESFAYLERLLRNKPLDSKTQQKWKIKPLGFVVTLEYSIFSKANPEQITYKIKIGSLKPEFYYYIGDQYKIIDHPNTNNITLPFIIGYASGLHENLQRPFMKNTLQFYETIRIKQKRTKELALEQDVNKMTEIAINYKEKYPHIFRIKPFTFGNSPMGRSEEIEEINNPISNMIFMDYDCNSLLIASLAVLNNTEIKELFPSIKHCLPYFIRIRYNFENNITGEDSIKDIQLLRRIINPNDHIGKKAANNELFELYDLDYLSGEINIDLTDPTIRKNLINAHYEDPLTLFNRLYKFQLLGIKSWRSIDKKNLLKDTFFETVKKPLKGKLPLTIEKLKLSDINSNSNTIDFDDLSDGEAQLIEILAAVRLFKNEETLFLFDEPETHLNPAWRTNFHNYIEKASGKNNNQIFLSTHSPFMVSSLKANNIFYFERNNDRTIHVIPSEHETYGASFDVLIKQFFGLQSLISQTAVQEIKQHLKGNKKEAREWIDKNLGDSMEKAYLLRKLQG